MGSYLNGKPSGGVFEPKNLNNFGYAHNNPVVLKDVDGNFIPLLIGAVIVVDRLITAYDVGSDVYDYATGQKTAGQIVSERAPGYAVKLLPGGGIANKLWRGGKWVYRRVGSRGRKLAGRFKRRCSFDASTEVLTKDGLKRIDQLAVNELVFAKDEKSGEAGWKQVRDRYINKYNETVLIRVAKADGGQEEIISNRIHPFFVKDKGWLRADKLEPGFELQTAKGDWTSVIAVRITKKPLLAYNLEVADYHSYFVGKVGAWVHNGGDCDPNLPKMLPGPGKLMDHHLFPQQFKEKFKAAGIDIHDFTVTLGEGTHLKGVHGKGLGQLPGKWNKQWEDFFDANPNARKAEIFRQLHRMKEEFQLKGLPVHRYRVSPE